jgi:hypothetical protein
MEDMDWNELELDSGLNEPLPVPVFESGAFHCPCLNR